MVKNIAIGTGRRKTAVARVFVRDGSGKIVVNGKDVKALPDGMRYPNPAAMTMAIHSAEEFTNLAAILPSLYAEEKDNW